MLRPISVEMEVLGQASTAAHLSTALGFPPVGIAKQKRIAITHALVTPSTGRIPLNGLLQVRTMPEA